MVNVILLTLLKLIKSISYSIFCIKPHTKRKTKMQDSLAYTGGFLLSMQIVPQIWKMYRTKSANDLSYVFMFSNLVGVSLMFVYGYIEHDRPLYITTSTSASNMIVALLIKYWYDNKDNRSPLESI